MGSKLFALSRIYIVGNRPYQILAVTKRNQNQTRANNFIWSFTLDVK